MTKPTNPATAFPLDGERTYTFPGMTLRDYFAGQAFDQAVQDYGEPRQGSVAGQRLDRGNPILPYATRAQGLSREDIIARQAYRYADAMLKAREAEDD